MVLGIFPSPAALHRIPNHSAFPSHLPQLCCSILTVQGKMEQSQHFFPHSACSNYSANYWLFITSPLLPSNSCEDLFPCARHITWGAAAKALGVEFLFLRLGILGSVLKGIFQSCFGHLGFLLWTSQLLLKYFFKLGSPAKGKESRKCLENTLRHRVGLLGESCAGPGAEHGDPLEPIPAQNIP